jgi:hypothetical protein
MGIPEVVRVAEVGIPTAMPIRLRHVRRPRYDPAASANDRTPLIQASVLVFVSIGRADHWTLEA